MPNIGKAIKDEIVRLARKEAKAATTPLRKPAGTTRSTLADLKHRVAALEKETKRLAGVLAKVPQPQSVAVVGQKARITGKGMRSLRRKLHLSGEQLGKLLGVTVNAVYKWETKNGPLRVRQTTRAAILAIRDLGAREAKAKLAEMGKEKKPARKARQRK